MWQNWDDPVKITVNLKTNDKYAVGGMLISTTKLFEGKFMGICSNCLEPGEESAAFCGFCGTKIEAADQSNEPESDALVNISSDAEIPVKTGSAADSQITLGELKSKREELALDKKKIVEQMNQIRANHAAALENRGSLFQGSENVGRFVKVLQSASREAAQRNLEHDLSPYEEELKKIEAMQTELEQQISEVESFIQ